MSFVLDIYSNDFHMAELERPRTRADQVGPIAQMDESLASILVHRNVSMKILYITKSHS